MIAGLYIAGQSPFHRAGAGVKLLALLALGSGVFVLHDWVVLLLVMGSVMALYRAAGFGFAVLWGQLRPLLWLLALFFAVQLWLNDWQAAVMVIARLVSVVLFAGLVTLSTRTSDLLAALERAMGPLRPIGVNPEKVSLAISMVLRFIPVIAAIGRDIRDAQYARGLDRSMLAMVVPLIVRTLKMADDVADAIDARSFDPE